MKTYTYLILDQLLHKQKYVTIQELADALDVSKRLIQDLLFEVDEELHQHQLSQTERVPNRGIRIKESELNAVRALCKKASTTYELLTFTQAQDRCLFLLFLLLCAHGKINLEPLADRMQVSIRTMSNDMNNLRKELATHGLRLQFDKRIGYTITGNSFVARTMLITKLKAKFSMHTPEEIASVFQRLYALHQEELRQYDQSTMKKLYTLLVDLVPSPYEEQIIDTLLLYIMLILYGPSSPISFELTKQDQKFLMNSYSFTLAKIIRIKVSEVCDISISEEEDYFLSILLHSYPGNEKINLAQNYPFEVEVVTQKILKIVQDDQHYDFEADTELYHMIVNHLIALMYRVTFHAQISNPLLDMVKSKYASMHASTLKALKEVEPIMNMQISEDECSFFTLYFASSMEKIMEMKQDRVTAIIVCNAGNAVSRLLQYKLMNHFHMQIVDISSEKALYQKIHRQSVDLIITVVDIDMTRIGTIPCVKVDALLQEQDYQKLHRYLHHTHEQREENCTQEAGAGLLDLLQPGCFQVNASLASMDALIQESGKLLEEQGYCDDVYGDLMVSVAHSFGVMTHIMIAPGILLPHAGISEHVYRAGISFVRTRKVIMVNGKAIHCAFALCTTDKQIHQRAIQELGQLLNQEDFLIEITKVETYESLKVLVQRCL